MFRTIFSQIEAVLRRRRRVPARGPGIAIAALLASLVAILLTAPLAAQSAISADGVVESKAGGFKFPDGTVQETAASPLRLRWRTPASKSAGTPRGL